MIEDQESIEGFLVFDLPRTRRLEPTSGHVLAENPKRQCQKRCLLETANTCTQKLRTRLGGVFAVLVTPCDHRGPMGLVGEASPDKCGSLHNYSELRCCARRRSTTAEAVVVNGWTIEPEAGLRGADLTSRISKG